MESRVLIILSLCVLPFSAWAETAADYMHRGAQKYIFGDEAAATKEVTTGLQKFPADVDLQRMAGLLTKQPRQQQQDQSQDGKDQKQQDAQDESKKDKQDDPGEDQNKAESSPPKPERDGSEGATPSPAPGDAPPTPSPDQQGEPSPTPGQGDDNGEEGDAATSPTPGESPPKDLRGEVKGAGEERPDQQAAAAAEAEAMEEARMTPEQAERLLRAMREEEQRVQLDERRATRRVYNDW